MPGYSDKPLWKKLGVKEGFKILLINISRYPEVSYLREFTGAIDTVKGYESGLDMIHLFADSLSALSHEMEKASQSIKKNGMIWISWPKKSSKKDTDITEDRIRDIVLPMGLVDVKVCSVTDELWSGLKVVWRQENR